MKIETEIIKRNKYITDDGCVFYNEEKAIHHEKILKIKKEYNIFGKNIDTNIATNIKKSKVYILSEHISKRWADNPIEHWIYFYHNYLFLETGKLGNLDRILKGHGLLQKEIIDNIRHYDFHTLLFPIDYYKKVGIDIVYILYCLNLEIEEYQNIFFSELYEIQKAYIFKYIEDNKNKKLNREFSFVLENQFKKYNLQKKYIEFLKTKGIETEYINYEN